MENQISPNKTMKLVKKAIMAWKNRFSPKNLSNSLDSILVNKTDMEIEIDIRKYVDKTSLINPSQKGPKKVCLEYGPTTNPEKTIKLKLIVPKHFLERAKVRLDDMSLETIDDATIIEDMSLESIPAKDDENCRNEDITPTSLNNLIEEISEDFTCRKSLPLMGISALRSQYATPNVDSSEPLLMETFYSAFSNLIESVEEKNDSIPNVNNQKEINVEECQMALNSTLNQSSYSISLDQYLGDFEVDEMFHEGLNLTFKSIVDTYFDSQAFLQEALGECINMTTSTVNHQSSSVGTLDVSSLLSRHSTIEASQQSLNSVTVNAAVQLQIIMQTSKALTLCMKNKKFFSTIQHIEAEKILLVATRRRDLLLKKHTEIQNREVDRHQTATILDVHFFLRNFKYNTKPVRFFIALAEYETEVFASPIVCAQTPVLKFPFNKTFENLPTDFKIEISIYCLNLKKLNSFNDKASASCPFANRLRSKRDSDVIRRSSFKFMGKSSLVIDDMHDKHITLKLERPYHPCLGKFFNLTFDSANPK